ncbi:GHMP kinase [Paraburkholderia caribensis]|uniref:GHMP family kinase ATP-binding protein n=1 Tax=Paraburkholderia caribensis TaxID=75105 RepID=UPI000D174508|nr:GHMP kinase [Paraburkholderia caribensis]PTB30334.1 GHMP kinase [Paraburkholderia caribensis]
MIITKTPLRLSFVGGGSDIPSYYREYGGAVLSTSIDKFVYLTLNKRFDHTLRVSYSQTEEVETVDQVQHRLVKAILTKLSIKGGLEITSMADVPSRGSGLGSSSAFTVGLLHCAYAYLGVYKSKHDLAAEACEIEIDILKEPIGKQDQYGAAMGGVNYIRFNQDDTIDIEPVVAPHGVIQSVEESMIMFYTGITRSASTILQKQSDVMASDQIKRKTMHRMVELADVMRQELTASNVAAVGEILHESWQLKKSLTEGISSGFIDDCYRAAMAAGATGGKLLGAGGGGFLVFFAPKERHPAIKAALSHLRHFEFEFERQGTSVIFYHQ